MLKKLVINLLIKLDLFNDLKIFKDKYLLSNKKKSIIENKTKFYSQFLNKEDLCFDVGANYGDRTKVFFDLGCKIVAVEPQPRPTKYLRKKFSDNITVEEKALGKQEGISQLYLSSSSVLSSLSREWIEKVRNGRFKASTWNRTINVEMTTLDALIAKYGIPVFCKIDVEGYEYEVLQGLTKPIRLLSFEYTIPEFTDEAIKCINYLSDLGDIECNYSSGESLKFGLDDWLKPDAFIPIFKELSAKNIIDGDIYVKFT